MLAEAKLYVIYNAWIDLDCVAASTPLWLASTCSSSSTWFTKIAGKRSQCQYKTRTLKDTQSPGPQIEFNIPDSIEV